MTYNLPLETLTFPRSGTRPVHITAVSPVDSAQNDAGVYDDSEYVGIWFFWTDFVWQLYLKIAIRFHPG